MGRRILTVIVFLLYSCSSHPLCTARGGKMAAVILAETSFPQPVTLPQLLHAYRPQNTPKHKDGMDTAKIMKADNFLTEDGQKVFEKDVQELTNKYTKKIEEAAVAKEADLMKV
ncbi:MAG: ribosome recycling factor [Luteolibacter sp.]